MLKLFYILRRYKISQIFWKLYYLFKIKKFSSFREIRIKYPKKKFNYFVNNSSTLLGNNFVKIFNHVFRDFESKRKDKLINYYINYFDFINSKTNYKKIFLIKKIINKWNIFFLKKKSIIFDQYPLSIRIFNLIKWDLKFRKINWTTKIILFKQADFLRKNLEYHLAGNHLITNLKAMIYASLYFDNKISNKWFNEIIKILDTQLDRQILADGCHYEKSPMYQLNVIQDFIDVCNILNSYNLNNLKIFRKIKKTINKMLKWSLSSCHLNKEIPFINDSNNNSYFNLTEIINNYEKTFKKKYFFKNKSFIHLKESGIIRIIQNDLCLILNLSTKDPKYPTGHSHSDTFSYEISQKKQKILVNKGISKYEISPDRILERSLESHNCTNIDNLNCTDVIDSFRVGKSAEINLKKYSIRKNNITIQAEHNGFSTFYKKNIFYRTWKISKNKIQIIDKFSLKGKIRSYIHLHPSIECDESNFLIFKGKKIIKLISDVTLMKKQSYWSPNFYNKIKSKSFNLFKNGNDLKIEYIIL